MMVVERKALLLARDNGGRHDVAASRRARSEGRQCSRRRKRFEVRCAARTGVRGRLGTAQRRSRRVGKRHVDAERTYRPCHRMHCPAPPLGKIPRCNLVLVDKLLLLLLLVVVLVVVVKVMGVGVRVELSMVLRLLVLVVMITSGLLTFELGNGGLALLLLLSRWIERQPDGMFSPCTRTLILVRRKLALARSLELFLEHLERDMCRRNRMEGRKSRLHRFDHPFLANLSTVLEPHLLSHPTVKQQ